MHFTRSLLAFAILVISSIASGEEGGRTAAPPLPAFAQRGLPGAAHKALQPLVGTWRVEKTLYVAGGTPTKPLTSREITARREWLAEGRFLRDVTEGRIGGASYWRLGLLGYSTMDKRYEWVTIDGLNANMMVYQGESGSGPSQPITVVGTFTDQGIISESTAGKPVRQRVVIRIERDDRHVIELYFRPPGEDELLADRSIYTRIGK
jgi:uncharacterized protein DUF1579